MKKLPSFKLCVLIALCALLAGQLKSILWPLPPPPNWDYISRKRLEAIGQSLLAHAEGHNGRLPLTLWQLSPSVFAPDDLARYRFVDPRSECECDWLYFPRLHLGDIHKDTILAAAPIPVPFHLFPWQSPVSRRLVLYGNGWVGYQAETDFQGNIARQLRENPP